jgi:hypothetical protein
MSNTIIWKFPKVEKSKVEDLSDVILSVEYIVEGTDGENTFTRSGKVLLDPPATDSFIPYSNITNSLMVEWITARFPELVTAYTENINFELERLANSDKTKETPHFAE